MTAQPPPASRAGPWLPWLLIGSLIMAILLIVVLVLANQTTYYRPDIAGVVRTQTGGPVIAYQLADGRGVTIDLNTRTIIYGAMAPRVGDLLLAGSQPKPWVARIWDKGSGNDPPDCHLIYAAGTDNGDAVRIDVDPADHIGLEIPKAPGFVAQSDFASPRLDAGRFSHFCLDGSGRATRFGAY